jgi:plastocyanin
LGNRLAALLITVAVSACTSHNGATRDIVVVARGMSFVLPDRDSTPNPPIQLRAGERVRLVLKNEAPGLLHDLVIPELNVHIEELRAGESADVTFVVPDTPGQFEYRCQPHAEMMSGVVEVSR